MQGRGCAAREALEARGSLSSSSSLAGLRLVAARRVIVSLAVAMGVVLLLAGDAAAWESRTIGRHFNDGLDTRLSAQRVAEATRALGYNSHSYLAGRSAKGARDDGRISQVLGLFGHSNTGIFQTNEGANDALDEIVAAEGALEPPIFCSGTICSWQSYLLSLDTDDLEVAILAGCYTAGNDPSYWGSFPRKGRAIGMDATVSFAGLVSYPTTNVSAYGNYFWERWASYMQLGNTLGEALAKSRSDLVAAEGEASGWDRYFIYGARSDPQNVRLKPAGPGQPNGYRPLSLAAAASTSEQPVRVGGQSYLDRRTKDGVSYRLDRRGDLVTFAAPASSRGPIALSDGQAQQAAERFADDRVSWFSAREFVLTDRGRVRHGEGESLTSFTWRRTVGGIPGPAIVTTEVDRRTGRVVYASANRVRPRVTSFRIGRSRAIATARRASGAGSLVSAKRDVWRRPRWTVTFKQRGSSEGRFPNVREVVVDGRTGRVASVGKT